MNQQVPRPSGQWLTSRVERKGLKPRNAAYLIVAFWSVAIVVFGIAERLTDPKTFHTVWLGFWWAVQTVTTVGYGDVVPNSTAGKIMASFMMLGGLSLLAIVTATVTSAFVTRAQAQRRAEHGDPVLDRLEEIAAQLETIKADIGHEQGPAGPAEDGALDAHPRVERSQHVDARRIGAPRFPLSVIPMRPAPGRGAIMPPMPGPAGGK